MQEGIEARHALDAGSRQLEFFAQIINCIGVHIAELLLPFAQHLQQTIRPMTITVQDRIEIIAVT